MKRGPLIIVSGPSGSGKSTLIRRILQEGRLPLRLAVSATTRSPRPGEVNGVDYTFWTKERFEQELARGAFLEHATVHGNYYGTPRTEVDAYRETGTGVLLDIDVQGAEQVRRFYPDHVSIFVKLPRWEMYEERIRRRGSETDATVARRLETAKRELGLMDQYHHIIVNDEDLDKATAAFRELITQQFYT